MELRVGDRIELVSMENDPDPILPGTKGTITFLNPLWDLTTQVSVAWDNGRRLMVILPVDKIKKI